MSSASITLPSMRYAIEKSSGRRLSKTSISDIGARLHHALSHRGPGEKEPSFVRAIGAARQVRHNMAGLGYRHDRDDGVPAFVRADVELLQEVDRNGAKAERAVAESGQRHIAIG